MLIRTLVKMIPASVFGGEKPDITKDGGLIFHYADVGTTVKYLIGNKAYFKHSVAQFKDIIPGMSMVTRLLGI